MSYSADTFVADEQPTTAKWNKLWSNDASFNDGTGIADDAILQRHISDQAVGALQRKEVVDVGTFTTTGNGSLAVTGVGFKPKAVIIVENDTKHQSASVANFMIGFSDGTTERAIGFRAQEGGDISGSISTNRVAFLPGAEQAQSNDLRVASFDTDGFTLTVANYLADMDWAYICFG